MKGRLRNVAFNKKCLHAMGGDNGAELDVVDCSDLNEDQIIMANGFQVNYIFSY